jgi:hypothetical protein
MPSINDVFNQLVAVNGTLDRLDTDVVATRNSVDAVNATVAGGFVAVVQGLQAIVAEQHQTVVLLQHLSAQDDAIICALELISQNTCELLNEAVKHTHLLSSIERSTEELRVLGEEAQPAAALAFAEQQRIQARLDECCPPKPTEPTCTYERLPEAAAATSWLRGVADPRLRTASRLNVAGSASGSFTPSTGLPPQMESPAARRTPLHPALAG